jgi:polyribonucleotide nucleotidyltransferase
MEKRQKYKEKKPTFTVNMLVPYNVIGIIIGQGGSTIKKITEQTHAR